MIAQLDEIPHALDILEKTPQTLFYKGNPDLLTKQLISVVGTRRPSQYTKMLTTQLSQGLVARGCVVVSGGAMGVDALAHRAAFPQTIGVMANSLDITYPTINKTLLSDMGESGLLLSEYVEGTRATKYSFVIRNRIVVALGEALIITQADLNSGTMRSAEIAMDLGKPIYVLAQRVGESLGTQKLLQEGKATLISDVDLFLDSFATVQEEESEWDFFKNSPTLKESLERFGDVIYEWELEGKVQIKNLRVSLS